MADDNTSNCYLWQLVYNYTSKEDQNVISDLCVRLVISCWWAKLIFVSTCFGDDLCSVQTQVYRMSVTERMTRSALLSLMHEIEF